MKMKKLIIGAIAVLAAVSVNAASVTWTSGVVFGPSDADGKLVANSAYKLADSSTASMYLWLVADATATQRFSLMAFTPPMAKNSARRTKRHQRCLRQSSPI